MASSNWNIDSGPVFFDAALAVRPEEIGDAVAIFLSDESPLSIIPWEIMCYANVGEGQYRIGTFATRPPSEGDPASRLVGIGNVPGARGWMVSVRSLLPGTPGKAQLTLASSKSQGNAAIGVTPVKHSTNEARGNRVFTDVPVISPLSAGLLAPRSILYVATGSLREQGANSNTYVMLFDSATAPIAGALPFFEAHLGEAVAGSPSDSSNWRFDDGPEGHPIQFQLWVGTSTQGGTFAPDAAHSTSLHAVSARG